MLDTWDLDARILRRVVYKNKNQHGRSVYFRKLQHVERLSRAIRAQDLRCAFDDAAIVSESGAPDGLRALLLAHRRGRNVAPWREALRDVETVVSREIAVRAGRTGRRGGR